MKNVVGPRVRALRNRKGRKVTQEELAARLQAMGLRINQAALSKIENGERQVTDVEVLGICRALGVTTAELFHGTRLAAE
ncbi:MAG: helix-turn-helix transcriptional regulator [Chloroflexi bacterium]|nr:helix-turn-helix transcriptional regulator [Chloroflexota bacterium]